MGLQIQIIVCIIIWYPKKESQEVSTIKKITSSSLAILLTLGLILPIFTETVNAETITSSINSSDFKTNLHSPTIFEEKEQRILDAEILSIENEIDDYFDSIDYTEEEFNNLSEIEQDQVIEEFITDSEFIELENELQAKLNMQDQLSEPSIQPYVLPLLLAPVAATVGRVALQAIAKKGTSFARKYLKTRIKKLGKNYDVSWDVRGKGHELKSLVVVIQKKNGRKIGRVFAIDYGDIPLKPTNKKAIWHFHIAPDSGMHRTLKTFIPKGHKPNTRTIAY